MHDPALQMFVPRFWVYIVTIRVGVSHAFASVYCCLVVSYWEWADLLALLGDVYCIFITFPCDILCQVWYLIVSFPDLCFLSYFKLELSKSLNFDIQACN